MARAKRKAIITCAPTGAIHTPSMSEYLPVTPEEIAEASIAAAEAGAAILHLHARDPQDGRPSQDPELFNEFLPQIHNETNAVINISTGGAPQMTVEERIQPARAFKPELASLNMGTINFGLFPMLNRYEDDIKHDWERVHLGNKAIIFRNTFEDIEAIMQMGAENGTKFEFECYDIGHLYNLKYFADLGLVKPPFFIQSVFGIFGGIGGHPEDLAHMKRTADRLFGDDYHWSILGAGSNQMNLATIGATLGAHIRVGLEDSLWIGPGELAKTNAQQVEKVRRILEELSIDIATPDEAREMLKLKGADKVAIGANKKAA